MRCKCGFNSFDHHLVCPKCHRDLTARRRLLNLDLPAPGTVNFFQLAGRRMAVPQPLLGAAAGSEDFGEDLQPAEDIRPIALGANQPTSAGETASPQPWPGLSAYGAAAGEITPSPPRAFAVPAGEPPAGTEAADDFEVVQPVSWPWPEAAFTPVTPPPPHHAVMDQIKSALTETGDLNPEAEPYVPGGRGRTPAAPASTQARGAPEEGGGDDLSSLVGGLNLDELEDKL